MDEERPDNDQPEPEPVEDDPSQGLPLKNEIKGDPPDAETLEDAMQKIHEERER